MDWIDGEISPQSANSCSRVDLSRSSRLLGGGSRELARAWVVRARLTQQFGRVRPEQAQFGVHGVLLLHPSDRFVDGLTVPVVLASLPARQGLEEPMIGVPAVTELDRAIASGQ